MPHISSLCYNDEDDDDDEECRNYIWPAHLWLLPTETSKLPLLFCNSVTTGFCERGKPLEVLSDENGPEAETEVEAADVITAFVMTQDVVNVY